MKKRNVLSVVFLVIFVMSGLFCPFSVFAEQYDEKCGFEQPEVYEIVSDDETDVYSTGTRLASPEDAYWMKFSSDFYYNQLSASQKRVWDDLEAVCLNVITGNQNFEHTETVQNNGGFSREQMIELVYLFKYSNPQYYFLENSFTLLRNSSGITGVYLNIYTEFQNGQTRRQATDNFRSKIDKWVAAVNTGKYDEGKEKIAFDLLVRNTKYDANSQYNQSAYSLICNGRTVCAGYTGAMQILMNAVGIDTIEVTSSTHAWNLIKIHDEWYAVDVTWGDQDDDMNFDSEWSPDVLSAPESDDIIVMEDKYAGWSGISYDYYNKSNATIQYGNNSHYPEQWWNAYTPAVKYDSAEAQSVFSYSSPYFTAGNYIYFMVNDNNRLDSRYAKPIDVLDTAVSEQIPANVSFNSKSYIVKDSAAVEVRSFVRRLYNLVLQREADEAGLESWTNALLSKKSSGVDAGFGFVFSDECKQKNLSNEQFVEILYNTFMNRPSDAGGKTAWVSQLDAGVGREKVFEGFVLSAEFFDVCSRYGINVGTVDSVPGFAGALMQYRNRNANLTKFVARCYTQALGRTYETDGLEAWCKVIIEKSNTPKQVAQNFIFSDEFTQKNLDNTEYVKVLYRTFMGREADAGGLAAWVNVLDSGREDRAKVLEGFSDSAEFAEILASFGLN